ncbi:MAG: RDD family protein [Xanthomonadales bacterium]|nr:RDD family protein [Xanthomonadales bacterium]
MSTATSPRLEVETAPLMPRLLALVYDVFPLLGLWFAVAVLSYAGNGGEPVRPGSLGAWLEFLALVGVTFLYAGLSWRLGGQTLGMRAWRLRAVDANGNPPGWTAITLRFAVGVVSLAAAGLGFAWVLIDRERRSWHELASGTLTVRLPKR